MTKIRGKSHVTPDGSEAVPLSPDSWTTTQEIADLGSGGTGLPPQWSEDGHGGVIATVDDPTSTPLTIEAKAGDQAVHIFKAYNIDGDLAVDIDLNGVLDTKQVVIQTPPDPGTVGAGSTSLLPARVLITEDGTHSPLVVFGNEAGPYANQEIFRISVPGSSSHSVAIFSVLDPTDGAWQIGAANGQVAPLAVFWDNPFAVRLIIIGPNGEIGTSAGVPADGDINAGELFMGFDPTNGASKVLFKGKSADGTVVTGNLPLS